MWVFNLLEAGFLNFIKSCYGCLNSMTIFKLLHYLKVHNNVGYICKIWKKGGRLFTTHFFTNLEEWTQSSCKFFKQVNGCQISTKSGLKTPVLMVNLTIFRQGKDSTIVLIWCFQVSYNFELSIVSCFKHVITQCSRHGSW